MVIDSIIILTINGIEDTKECLSSLKATCDESVEVIVVDQGSNDGTQDYIRGFAKDWRSLRLETTPHNLGFAGGCNFGAQRAAGEVLWFVNNDIVVGSGWLGAMRDVLSTHKELAAVGPVSDNTGELQRDWRANNEHIYPNGFHAYVEERLAQWQDQVWYFPRLAGFFIGVRKDVFWEIGGFAEEFALGSFEDDELCRRIRAKGYRLGILPGVFVHHHGGRSFERAKIDFVELMNANRRLFLERIQQRPVITEGPLISIITTTRNRLPLLHTAIKSIVAQTYTTWEAIVVNDGGGSIVPFINGEFNDCRIRSYDEQWRGRGGALNFALRQARGEAICYLDDDDIWRPNHLSTLVDAWIRTAAGLVYSDAIRHFIRERDGRFTLIRSEINAHPFSLDELLGVNFIPNLCILHSAELIKTIGSFDENLKAIEDWDYWRRMAAVSEVVNVPIITAEYHVRVDNTSRNGLMARDRKGYLEIEQNIRLKHIPVEQNSEWMRLTGNQLINAGYLEEGCKVLKRALEKNPYNRYAIFDLIYHIRRSGLELGAKYAKIMEKVATWYATEFTVWRNVAYEAFHIGNYRLAEESLAMSLVTRRSEEDAVEIYRLLAQLYWRLENNASAAACLNKSAEIDDIIHVRDVRMQHVVTSLGYKLRTAYMSGGMREVSRKVVKKFLTFLLRVSQG